MNKWIIAFFFLTPLLFICEASGESIPLDKTHFPDDSFRSYLAEIYDLDADGKLDDMERMNIRTLNVSDRQIASLDGIEYFPELESLMCWKNQLTRLDVSENKRLQDLYCGENRLESLILSGCTELADLSCYNNQLTNLDVSSNSDLLYLTCSGNQLISLDVTENKKLKVLEINGCERTVEAPGGVFDLSTLSGFDLSRTSDWRGNKIQDGKLTVSSSGQVVYTYECGQGFQAEMALNITVIAAPTETPAPAPTEKPTVKSKYTFDHATYDGKIVSGSLSHVPGTAQAKDLQVRVTFFITGNHYMATAAEVENGRFQIEGVGPIEYISILAFGNGTNDITETYGATELIIQ